MEDKKFLVVAVNKNKGNVDLVTKFPMTYEQAVHFMETRDNSGVNFSNTFLTLAEVF